MNEVVCVAGVELLMDYLEGAVTEDVRASLEGHVAGCPRCVAFISSYQQVPRIVREATASVLPHSVEQSLRSFLRAQRRLPPDR
jgi:anti-sigma factor RsiW